MTLKTPTKIGKKPNIGIITWAFNSLAGEALIMNFINILEPLSNELFVITGNFPKDTISNKKIHIKIIKHKGKKEAIVIKVIRHILMQLRISLNLIKISKNVDIVIFFLGRKLLLPMISIKLLKKKTILVATGSASRVAETRFSKILSSYGEIIFSGIAEFLENINFRLVDRIAVESESSIGFLGLNKYRKKISITGAVYIDTDNFKIKEELKNKKNFIGYIGRLSPEKGVLNFAKAIPLILKEKGDLEFLIGGDGLLLDEIKKELKNNGSYDIVELTGWIAHDELPKYLNELKLIISPSYSEGGVPAVIMEAMACGTLVLVTPVAAVDIIKDGKTGFILEDNSPEYIAKNVIRALEHSEPEKIINSARNLVEKEFSYKKVVKQYRNMLYGMLYDHK